MITKSPLLGAQVSTAGGLANAFVNGEALGCTAIQIFTANSRSWSLNPCPPQQVAAFLAAQQRSTITAVLSHAGYLVNLGSPNTAIAKKSTAALVAELRRCIQLHVPFVVMHPGAHLQATPQSSIMQIAALIDQVLDQLPRSPVILLENTAGQGTVLGHTLEQLADIRSRVTHQDRLGFCLDTCHAHAAGYDLTTSHAYQTFWKKTDQILGIENVRAIHLNDTKKALGSRIDRHARIATGTLGLTAFKLIMHDPRLMQVPKIIETPRESNADHREELELLRSL